MALKFTGVDASGKRTSLTLTSGSLCLLADRLTIGEETWLRYSDGWMHTDGVSPRFAEVLVEEEEQASAPAPAPAPVHVPQVELTPAQQGEQAREAARTERAAREPAKR